MMESMELFRNIVISSVAANVLYNGAVIEIFELKEILSSISEALVLIDESM